MAIDFDRGDSLADLLGAPVIPVADRVVPPASYTPPNYSEPCKKCGGSGQFYGYSGRHFGPCFACKGKGRNTFRTSPERRADNRANAADRKARNAESFIAANAAMVEWLKTTALRNHERGGTFTFPHEMLLAIARYGSLTDGQMAAVARLMERDKARTAERTARADNAKPVDVSRIESAFQHARNAAADDGEGVKWLKLRLDTFTFSDAPARGQWPAAIFVREGESKLGRIAGGKFIRSFSCDDATESRVIAAASDPAAAAVAYGLRTGSCSICARELTNAESRARGIGPICARRYGF